MTRDRSAVLSLSTEEHLNLAYFQDQRPGVKPLAYGRQ